jgi:hypothetical protein
VRLMDMDFAVLRPLVPHPAASNPVLVHWLVRLLHASFRPNLAVGHALAFRYPSPPSGWEGTFTPKLSNMLSTGRTGVPACRAARCAPPLFRFQIK